MSGSTERHVARISVSVQSPCEACRLEWTRHGDADTGERVLIPPPTVREVMGDYFRHGNHKMAEPHGIGAMEPRDCLSVTHATS